LAGYPLIFDEQPAPFKGESKVLGFPLLDDEAALRIQAASTFVSL